MTEPKVEVVVVVEAKGVLVIARLLLANGELSILPKVLVGFEVLEPNLKFESSLPPKVNVGTEKMD